LAKRNTRKFGRIFSDRLESTSRARAEAGTRKTRPKWDLEARTIWIVDAHRDGERFIVHADEKLTAFLELESVIRACGELC